MEENNIKAFLVDKLSNCGCAVSQKEGSLLLVKRQSGKEYQIDIRVLDLIEPRRDKDIKIPKSDWNYELPENLYVAYIVVFGEDDFFIHLIPSSVFKTPDRRIFFDNNQEERFKHFSNLQIRFFNNIIEELSKYAFDRVVGELT